MDHNSSSRCVIRGAAQLLFFLHCGSFSFLLCVLIDVLSEKYAPQTVAAALLRG